MYWINGILRKTISLDCRALHFGDGFFTTAKIHNSQVELLDWHMNRLMLSARRLMFDNVNFNLLYQEILEASTYSTHGVIKIIITRINSNKIHGYRCNNNESLRIIRISPLPKHYSKWYEFGIKLKTSRVRLSRNTFFAGIKHLNRLEQVMISYDICKNQIADEALVLDINSNVIECCNANIFWRCNYEVFTPNLYYSGVNGIIRQLILKLLPALGYTVTEVMVGVEHLKNMDEVFITNSLLPLVSVNSINNYVYSDKTLFNLLNFHMVLSKSIY